MEKFLLRAKVTQWSSTSQREYTTWAEGYLNLVAMTEEGPKYAFAELECDKLVYAIGQNWCYQPTLHHNYRSSTIGRYIGIKDKNGKKIFEGDIVRFHGGYAEPNWVGEVMYNKRNALFVFVGIMPCRRCSNDTGEYEVQISSKDKSTFEIIGNRWDTPELLGEGAYKKLT